MTARRREHETTLTSETSRPYKNVILRVETLVQFQYMSKKKRLPNHGKLVEAGKMAREMLAKRKIIAPDDQSRLAEILATHGAPILPGIPVYLPYVWTIDAARRVLVNLVKEWHLKHEKDALILNNIAEFSRFVIQVLKEEEHKLDERIHVTVQLKQFDFKLLHQKDAVKGIRKLLVDSFAVSVIAKSNDDVANYVDWFRSWTDGLLRLWKPKNAQT